ncbi:MAG: hypothetical protein H0W73_15910 [Bacteroidetes bacterium]|nr:hypothetical protein [Bacteroidota bacterium]
MKGTLILHRKKNFNGMAVGMDIFINDKPYGRINSGEQKEIELEAGTYNLKVQQNVKSGEQQITIEENKTIKYSFTPNLLSIITVAAPLIAFGLLFLFKLPLSYAALILLPGAIASVYLLTAGKTKYFLFKRENQLK